MAQASGLAGPLSLGAVRCAAHMEDAARFAEWRGGLEAFVLAEHGPTSQSGQEGQDDAEEPGKRGASGAADTPTAMEGADDADDAQKEASGAADSDGDAKTDEADALSRPSAAETACAAIACRDQDPRAAPAAAAARLLREARAQQLRLRSSGAAGWQEDDEEPQWMSALVRGAVSVVCAENLLPLRPEAEAAAEGAAGEVLAAVSTQSRSLLGVAASAGAWHGATAAPAASDGAEAFAAAAADAVRAGEKSLTAAHNQTAAAAAQRAELDSIRTRVQAETEACAASRQKVKDLEEQLRAAKEALGRQVEYRESLSGIRDKMESALSEKEGVLAEAHKGAEEALAGSKRDQTLLLALQGFLTSCVRIVCAALCKRCAALRPVRILMLAES